MEIALFAERIRQCVYSYVYLLYMYTYTCTYDIYMLYIYIFVDYMHLHAERRGKCSAESSNPSLSALRLKNAARFMQL